MATKFVWHEGWPAPAALPVRQVYAWIVNEHGQVLLLEMPGGWNLPGGTPEATDADWLATLRRELLEEASVTVRDIVPLGYQEVRVDDGQPFAQLRVAARIDAWLDAAPDPDTGMLYRREWVSLIDAAELLGWGTPGRAQAASAAAVAIRRYGVSAALCEVPGETAHGAVSASSRVTQLV